MTKLLLNPDALNWLVQNLSKFPFDWPIYMYKVKKPEISIKNS